MPDAQTLTLTDFLLARIAEDEQAALAHSLWTDSGSPIPYDQQVRRVLRAAERAEGTVKVHYLGRSWLAGGPGSVGRILAECEAKRRIVAEHKTIRAAYPNTTIETDPCCETCSAHGEYPGEFPCPTLCLLALPYADHPDYQEEEFRP